LYYSASRGKQIYDSKRIEDDSYWPTPYELVEVVKDMYRIININELMTPSEIKQVMKHIGANAPDTIHNKRELEGEPPFLGRIGIGMQLFITLVVFPDYYTLHELWQRN